LYYEYQNSALIAADISKFSAKAIDIYIYIYIYIYIFFNAYSWNNLQKKNIFMQHIIYLYNIIELFTLSKSIDDQYYCTITLYNQRVSNSKATTQK